MNDKINNVVIGKNIIGKEHFFNYGAQTFLRVDASSELVYYFFNVDFFYSIYRGKSSMDCYF